MDEPPVEAPSHVLFELGPALPEYIRTLEEAGCTHNTIHRSISQLFALLHANWDWDEIERLAYRLDNTMLDDTDRLTFRQLQNLADNQVNGFVLYVDFASDLLGAIESQRLYTLFSTFGYDVKTLLPERGCILLQCNHIAETE